MPPTIQALLAARLDRLDDGERAVIERGAIEGRSLRRGAVEALVARDAGGVDAHLLALVRMDLVRPRPRAGEGAFRFRHQLIRDAAYDALPEGDARRAARALRRRLEDTGDPGLGDEPRLPPRAARRSRAELGAADDHGRRVAATAAAQLAAAGHTATGRGDLPAAANLLERAIALPRPTGIDRTLVADLVNAFFQAGRVEDAFAYAGAVVARAAAAGDLAAELCARIDQGGIRTYL